MTGIVRPGGQVLIDPDALPGVAELLRDAVARRPTTSALPPPVRHALAAIDTAAREHLDQCSVSEHAYPARMNIESGLGMTTARLAGQLDLSPQYVAKLAKLAGVERLQRGMWPPDAPERIHLHRGNT